MTTVTGSPPRLMTTDELLALPDDGVERWLIRGQLREAGLTRRNYRHSAYTSEFVYIWSIGLRPIPRSAAE